MWNVKSLYSNIFRVFLGMPVGNWLSSTLVRKSWLCSYAKRKALLWHFSRYLRQRRRPRSCAFICSL